MGVGAVAGQRGGGARVFFVFYNNNNNNNNIYIYELAFCNIVYTNLILLFSTPF